MAAKYFIRGHGPLLQRSKRFDHGQDHDRNQQ